MIVEFRFFDYGSEEKSPISVRMMTNTETYALHVSLSASQTRKRLKGHGFGVKRVEATDRNQAMITHTATGDHLRQLELLFADVVFSPNEDDSDRTVEQPPSNESRHE